MRWIATIAGFLFASGMASAQTNPNDLNWPAFDGVYVVTNDDEFIEIPASEVTRIQLPSAPSANVTSIEGIRHNVVPTLDLRIEVPVDDFRGLFLRGHVPYYMIGYWAGYISPARIDDIDVFVFPQRIDLHAHFRVMAVDSEHSLFIEPRELGSPEDGAIYGFAGSGSRGGAWAFRFVDD